jgi:hypothetical protein
VWQLCCVEEAMYPGKCSPISSNLCLVLPQASCCPTNYRLANDYHDLTAVALAVKFAARLPIINLIWGGPICGAVVGTDLLGHNVFWGHKVRYPELWSITTLVTANHPMLDPSVHNEDCTSIKRCTWPSPRISKTTIWLA